MWRPWHWLSGSSGGVTISLFQFYQQPIDLVRAREGLGCLIFSDVSDAWMNFNGFNFTVASCVILTGYFKRLTSCPPPPWNKVSLCSIDWPGTCYVYQVDLRLTEVCLPLPLSTRMLKLKACHHAHPFLNKGRDPIQEWPHIIPCTDSGKKKSVPNDFSISSRKSGTITPAFKPLMSATDKKDTIILSYQLVSLNILERKLGEALKDSISFRDSATWVY